jgi:hypothetical protein
MGKTAKKKKSRHKVCAFSKQSFALSFIQFSQKLFTKTNISSQKTFIRLTPIIILFLPLLPILTTSVNTSGKSIHESCPWWYYSQSMGRNRVKG